MVSIIGTKPVSCEVGTQLSSPPWRKNQAENTGMFPLNEGDKLTLVFVVDGR
jgi:hypothetical protein